MRIYVESLAMLTDRLDAAPTAAVRYELLASMARELEAVVFATREVLRGGMAS